MGICAYHVYFGSEFLLLLNKEVTQITSQGLTYFTGHRKMKGRVGKQAFDK